MGYSLACKDAGADCDHIVRAETKEKLMAEAAAHGKNVHGYTDEQLSDPAMAEKLQSVIKTD